MEKKVFGVAYFLLLLFVDGFMVMQTEARTCYSRSRNFRGMCFFKHQRRNCKFICEKEKFMFGICSHRICLCGNLCPATMTPPHHPPPPLPRPPQGGAGGGGGGGGGGGEGGGGGGGEGGGGGGEGGGGGGEGGGGGGGGEGGAGGGGGGEGGENPPQTKPSHKR